MPKDYQEELIEEWDNLIKVSTKFELRNWLKQALTTYGNARVEEIIKIAEGMKQEIPTYLNKRGHHTNSAHRKIKYNQALTDLIKTIKKLYMETCEVCQKQFEDYFNRPVGEYRCPTCVNESNEYNIEFK